MDYPLTIQDIQRLDRSGYIDLLRSFPLQMEQASGIMAGVSLKRTDALIDQVVVAGVGGSAIGGDLLRTYLMDTARIPILVQRSYSLPAFVGPSTLVFVSSYSGNTEETLSACREALARRARIIGIASGGELNTLSARAEFPLIRIPGGYPPRAALGFSFIALLESMVKLGLVADQNDYLQETRSLISQKCQEYDLKPGGGTNLAQQVAMEMSDRLPVIYTWGHRFEAVAMRWRGQLAEVSKQLSSHHLLPEMNHNEIVGWQVPAELLKKSVVVLLRDDQEPRQIANRMEITKELIAPWTAGIVEVWATGESLLARLFSLIYLGDFVSLYLAALNGVDPTPIARIEELKRRLADG